jgi:hypothetical protein
LVQCVLVWLLATAYYFFIAVHTAEKAVGEDCLDRVGVPGLSLDSEPGEGRRARVGGIAAAASASARAAARGKAGVEMTVAGGGVGGDDDAGDAAAGAPGRPSEAGSDAGLLRLYRLPSDSLATSGGGGGGSAAGVEGGESPTSRPAGRP